MSQFHTERRLKVPKRTLDPLKVILPLLKQKALARDMTLPFAKSLEGFNSRAHAKEPRFKISQLWLLLKIWHN
jgi:hypothetical protein